MTLANKYRPTKFSDVCEQEVICTVLNKQIEQGSYSHALLFAGPAGCGKTTCAKIFANQIDGEILELDCASHNGVSDIKEIVEYAKVKSLIHNNKTIILDECHTLTPQAWSSLLITLEENLPNAIFIFCTTDAQKIPNTIISRVQRFNFIPISTNNMMTRLKTICNQESIKISDEVLNLIIKVSKGNLRQALTNIDKCLLYGDFTEENVCKVLNICSTDIMTDLYNAFDYKDKTKIIDLIESVYNNGYELHHFVRQFLDYSLTKTNLDLVERLLVILQDIRYDDSPKNIIIARLII